MAKNTDPEAVKLPKGWRITAHGPVGEGVEATGPDGARVVTAWEDQLPAAIKALSNGSPRRRGVATAK
jgi:hypothetical protein